ncbi:MAG: apolipoprotein N-acyltransferase [Campylobacter sp.]
MKQKNLRFAWVSLWLNFLRAHFSTKIIIKAFVGAILISNFIYLSVFELKILDFISPFLFLAGICVVINLPRSGYFAAGFFVGILWFYWISFSFVYYGLSWLIPLIILGIGIIYGALFLIAAFPSFVCLRAVVLFLISYVHPFGFNWLNFEAALTLGAFDPSARGLIFIFLAAICLVCLPKFYKLASILCLVFALQISSKEPRFLPFEVELTQTSVAQKMRWDKHMKDEFINRNLAMIDDAINSGKRLIIFPESAFPTFMTHERELQNELKEKSHRIAVVAGALAYENGQNYNSAFLFDGGRMQRFDKFILVPFGEEIPLPGFIKDFVNRVFFGGASDFIGAKSVSDYEIDGVKIRSAVCYEATTDPLFAGDFSVMIAITNNGWFTPSTEPALQRILLKYYATKYGKTIYHAVNGSRSEIITPKRALINFKE